MSESLQHRDFSHLLRQPSEMPLACTAYTLINALTLSGAVIPNEDARQLISSVEETLAPLEFESEQHFAQARGFKLEKIPYQPQAVSDYRDLVHLFSSQLSSTAGTAGGHGTGVIDPQEKI